MTPVIHRFLTSPVFARGKKHASTSPEYARKEECVAKRASDPITVVAVKQGILVDPISACLSKAIFEDRFEFMKPLVQTPENASRALVYLCSVATSPMHAEMAKYLVQKAGANPNADNITGTALALLCGRMKLLATPQLIKILTFLLDAKADPNLGKPNPLEITMNPEAVTLLLKHGALPSVLSIQNALLRDDPCFDTAKLLIEAGVKTDFDSLQALQKFGKHDLFALWISQQKKSSNL